MRNYEYEVRWTIARRHVAYWVDYIWDLFIDKLLYNGENAQLIHEFYYGDLRRSK